MATLPEYQVTVCIPTIPGREELLDRALGSVWAQTRPAAAVAIVRDGRRRGAWWARTVATQMALTGWVAFLDDDDVWKPNHLEVLCGAGERHHAGLVYGYPECIGDRDPLAVVDDTGRLVPSPISVPFGARQADYLRRVANFIPLGYVVRTHLVEEVGGFPEPFSAEWPQAHEDWGFLVRLLDAGASFHNAGEITWEWHLRHPAQTGGRAG
jgi:glycosyltransferase involved in cell wall biosynthesis